MPVLAMADSMVAKTLVPSGLVTFRTDQPMVAGVLTGVVVIIDDDTALPAACRVGLHTMGHEVRTAGTGNSGLSDAAVHPPDLIVLDLGLPDVDGMQVCSRLRSWTDTPVIVLSADGSEDRKVGALNGGADDYVTKPFGARTRRPQETR